MIIHNVPRSFYFLCVCVYVCICVGACACMDLRVEAMCLSQLFPTLTF